MIKIASRSIIHNVLEEVQTDLSGNHQACPYSKPRNKLCPESPEEGQKAENNKGYFTAGQK